MESDARTDYLKMQGPNGADILYVAKIEDMIAQRVYRVKEYPSPKVLDCAIKLLMACRAGYYEVNWSEVRRLPAPGP